MPVDVRDRAESVDRHWYFLVDAITIGFLAGLMLWKHVPGSRIGLRIDDWHQNAVIGIAAAAFRVLLLSFLRKLFPGRTPDGAVEHLQRGSALLWAFIFFAGAFAEEMWIALCVVALIMAGHSNALSVFVTAAVFGVAHFEYRFGALVTAMYGAISALLFLWLGSLIPMFLFHFIGNLGSLYWARHQ